MENKRNLKYFKAKGLSIPTIIGGLLFIFGIVLATNKTTNSFSVLVVIAALLVIVISYSGRAKGSEIDHQVAESLKDFEETAQIRLEVYEKDFLRIIEPIRMRGFDYLTDGFMFKRDGDGKNRTSIYNALQLFFTENNLCVYIKRFSLINSEEDSEVVDKIPYTELDHCEYEECFYTNEKGRHFRYYTFSVKKHDGSDAVKVCTMYGADVDKAIEDIDRVIEVRTREINAKAERRAEKRAALDGENE